MSDFPKNTAQVTGEVVRSHSSVFGEGRTVSNATLKVIGDNGKTLFIRVVGFDSNGDTIKDVGEGTRVYAKGNLSKARDWTDKDGNKRYGEIELIVDEIAILGKRSGADEPVKVDPKKKVEF